jgi:hypothetical protein
VELSVKVATVTTSQAICGMRRPFVRSFGRGWIGRQLAAAAWPAFFSSLQHGAGIAVAAAYAQAAAEERNLRALLVARWSEARIEATVRRAVQNAANAT